MKQVAKHIFIITFIWTGFILAISFMEAWVKFRAPTLTLAQGLDVGRQVFHALSIVEKGFLALQLGAVIFFYKEKAKLMVLGGIVVILVLQWVWLLPVLDARAALYIAHEPVPGNSPHLYFVLMEAAKVGLLLALGVLQLKTYRSQSVE